MICSVVNRAFFILVDAKVDRVGSSWVRRPPFQSLSERLQRLTDGL
jgi:hypothetical protein